MYRKSETFKRNFPTQRDHLGASPQNYATLIFQRPNRSGTLQTQLGCLYPLRKVLKVLHPHCKANAPAADTIKILK